jgi:hypothetical protein
VRAKGSIGRRHEAESAKSVQVFERVRLRPETIQRHKRVPESPLALQKFGTFVATLDPG